MYKIDSEISTEFISDEEILESLEYAKKNKNNLSLAKNILERAKNLKGLNHRDAIILLENENKNLEQEIFLLANKIKKKFYGNRIVLFAPLYLSNYCVNGCIYCPYCFTNKNMPRKKLSQEEIRQEVTFLQDMGHKRLALESGEDPINCPIEYILESIDTIYKIKHKNGAIRRVNVNIAATEINNYKKLRNAAIGTYILFQETYNKKNYERLHPTGPKHNYNYHTEAMDRAMRAGIDDVGLGVLFGLDSYKYDLVGLLMHAEHLEKKFGVGPHTISVPRIRPADNINPENFNSVPDNIFKKIIAILRIAVPYTGMIISTRESKKMREEILNLGISQISAASNTSVGGYCVNKRNNLAQFDIDDTRSLDEIVYWLLELNHIPSFCTACYREGRTGDKFMLLVKSKQILNCCEPNALLTLQEYLEDYASTKTKLLGNKVIADIASQIQNSGTRESLKKYLADIKNGKRDFRF